MKENIFLFHGENTPQIKSHSHNWQQKFEEKYKDSFDLQIIEDSKTFQIQNLILEAKTVPFLCEKKLIIAKNILHKFKKEYTDELLNTPDSTIIIFIEHRKVNKTDKELAKLQKKIKVTNFEINDSSNKQIIDKIIEATKAQIPQKFINELTKHHAKNPNKLLNTTTKIATFAYEKKLSSEDFYKLADIEQEPNVFNFLDTIYTNKSEMLKQFKENLDHNPDPYKILYMIIWHLKTLLQIKTGNTTDIKPFIVKKHSKTAKNLELNKLNSLLSEILKIDQQSKTGLINGQNQLTLAIELALLNNT
jgi:hypothetical protein